jgi:tetratricopeptide (TPR) repeat protein
MKIDSRINFVVCLLSLVLFTLPCFAQNGAIQVKCVDASGALVSNAKVFVSIVNTQKAKDKKSDAQGMAEFTKLDDGAYRVFGRKEGFAPALYEFVILKGSAESVTLTFAPGADKKLYFEDPAEAQRAAGFLQQGLQVAQQGKYEDAGKLFAQSLEINPSGPEALYYSGVALLQLGKFDQAADMLSRAAQAADIFKAAQSPAGSGANPYEQVAAGAKKLLQQVPSMRGEFALRQKNYDQAIKIYSDVIKAGPENPEDYVNLAVALANTGKLDEALAALDKAIQLKPGEKSYADMKTKVAAKKEGMAIEKAQSAMNEGNKMLQDGDPAGALKKYEEARSLISEDKQAPLWRQIGKANAKLNQEEAAVAAYKKSMELAPADKMDDYRNAFAQFYLDAKKYDDAINVLADPKSSGSKNPEQTLMDLVKTWKTKEPSFAIAALEKVIKINPENAEAYFELGQLCYMDGKSKDARTKELLNKYLEIGKDADNIQRAKDMLVLVNRRSK